MNRTQLIVSLNRSDYQYALEIVASQRRAMDPTKCLRRTEVRSHIANIDSMIVTLEDKVIAYCQTHLVDLVRRPGCPPKGSCQL